MRATIDNIDVKEDEVKIYVAGAIYRANDSNYLDQLTLPDMVTAACFKLGYWPSELSDYQLRCVAYWTSKMWKLFGLKERDRLREVQGGQAGQA